MVTFDYKKSPITQIADYIIMYSAKSGASDIHFDPHDDGLMVRIRIDGDLQDYTLVPTDYERNLTTRLKLLANMNITESRLPQDGSIKGKFGNLYLDMRVSSLPTNKGEKIVIRILDYSRSLEGLESLGFSHLNFEKLKRMIAVPNGILLVTGATGSGKSTTTYSILQALNKKEVNIITVEDPVEMNIEGLNQVQVNSEIGLDFATVLRSILRQDPNIILIGEIRDSETAKIAVRASITGHFVLSTIHTNNSLSTIERLLDMDVERYLLSSALTGIISQRLAKKVCHKCRVLRDTTEYERKVFKKALGKDVDKIYDANHNGCSECHNGYRDRIAVQEVLEINDDIRLALNNENLTKEEMRKMVYTNNVITLLQDGLNKVLEGTTTFEEIYRIIEIDIDDIENVDIENEESNETTDNTNKEDKIKNNNIELATTKEETISNKENNEENIINEDNNREDKEQNDEEISEPTFNQTEYFIEDDDSNKELVSDEISNDINEENNEKSSEPTFNPDEYYILDNSIDNSNEKAIDDNNKDNEISNDEIVSIPTFNSDEFIVNYNNDNDNNGNVDSNEKISNNNQEQELQNEEIVSDGTFNPYEFTIIDENNSNENMNNDNTNIQNDEIVSIPTFDLSEDNEEVTNNINQENNIQIDEKTSEPTLIEETTSDNNQENETQNDEETSESILNPYEYIVDDKENSDDTSIKETTDDINQENETQNDEETSESTLNHYEYIVDDKESNQPTLIEETTNDIDQENDIQNSEETSEPTLNPYEYIVDDKESNQPTSIEDTTNDINQENKTQNDEKISEPISKQFTYDRLDDKIEQENVDSQTLIEE